MDGKAGEKHESTLLVQFGDGGVKRILSSPTNAVGETRYGFTWGQYLAVQRTATLPVLNVCTVDDDRVMQSVDIVASKSGRRLTIFPRRAKWGR